MKVQNQHLVHHAAHPKVSDAVEDKAHVNTLTHLVKDASEDVHHHLHNVAWIKDAKEDALGHAKKGSADWKEDHSSTAKLNAFKTDAK